MSTHTSHTPGPWVVSSNLNSRLPYAVEGNGYSVARIVWDEHMDSPQDEPRANARLIAAAPETAIERDHLREEVASLTDHLNEVGRIAAALLEALEGILEAAEFANMEQSPPGAYDPEINKARAAIKLARGGESDG